MQARGARRNTTSVLTLIVLVVFFTALCAVLVFGGGDAADEADRCEERNGVWLYDERICLVGGGR